MAAPGHEVRRGDRVRGALLLLAALAALTVLSAGGGMLAPAAEARELPPERAWELVEDLLHPDEKLRRRAIKKLRSAGDPSLLPAIVDSLFFTPRDARRPIADLLAELAGQHRGSRYHPWVDLVAERRDLVAKDGYLGFKGRLFSRIDRRFGEILAEGARTTIRPEEIVWGGVPFEGIPALEEPPRVPAGEAGSMDDAEIVFGTVAGGRAHAWPRRVLSWHEMANDRVGGRPVTLSFCTLCGSAVLFSGETSEGELTFGTSGLLYRSNKLMVDRATGTLWSNLTGRPVLGSLAGSGIELELLPLTITTWGEWRRRHPATTVAVPDPELARRWGFDYSPGAADARREGVSFPAGPPDDRLAPEREVFGLRLGDTARAWPLDRLLAAGVVHDELAGVPVVLVAGPGGAVRAYRRGDGRRFARGGAPDELVDEAGHRWRVTEEALAPLRAPEAPKEAGPEGLGEAPDPAVTASPAPLPRLPGIRAFWFGWVAFHPETSLGTGDGIDPGSS